MANDDKDYCLQVGGLLVPDQLKPYSLSVETHDSYVTLTTFKLMPSASSSEETFAIYSKKKKPFA